MSELFLYVYWRLQTDSANAGILWGIFNKLNVFLIRNNATITQKSATTSPTY